MRVHPALLLAALALLLAGCGSSHRQVSLASPSPTSGTSGSTTGRSRAIVTIKWPIHVPRSTTRLVPAAATHIYIVVTRNSDGATLATTNILQGTTTTEIDALPADNLHLTAQAIDDNGVVDAQGGVDFKTQPGVATSLSLTLDSTIESLALSPDTATIYTGDQFALDVAGVTSTGDYALLSPDALIWDVPSGSDSASVDSYGNVTAGRPGTAYIRVTDQESGQSGYATITVLPALASVTVTDLSYTSGSEIATVSAYDDYGNLIDPGDLAWDTDNGSFRVVDGENPQPLTVLSNAAPGSVRITATQLSTGYTASYDLTIDVGPPTNLFASANSLVAGGAAVRVTLLSPDGTLYPSGMWTWSGDNSDVYLSSDSDDPITVAADKAATGNVTLTVSLTGSPFQVFSGTITLPIESPPSSGGGSGGGSGGDSGDGSGGGSGGDEGGNGGSGGSEEALHRSARTSRPIAPATKVMTVHLPHTIVFHGTAHKAVHGTRKTRGRSTLHRP